MHVDADVEMCLIQSYRCLLADLEFLVDADTVFPVHVDIRHGSDDPHSSVAG